MTHAEQIREYFKENPSTTYDEVEEAVRTTNSTVRTNACRDLKAGRCVRLEDDSLDYLSYFEKETLLIELVEWKNKTRKE